MKSGMNVCGVHRFDVHHGRVREGRIESFATGDPVRLVDRKAEQRGGGKGPADPVAVCREDLNGLVRGWWGPTLAAEAFGLDTPAGPAIPARGGPAVGKLLADESWEQVRAWVSPPDDVETVGGRFRVERPCLHAGEHVDVFPAREEGREHLGRVAVHVLKREAAGRPAVRDWFRRRLDCWRRLAARDGTVLQPYDCSDAGSDRPAPFLVVDLVGPGGESLEAVVRRTGPLPPDRLKHALLAAAAVCRAADDAGPVRLVALPPRHFLVDPSGRLRLTGCEAAVLVPKRRQEQTRRNPATPPGRRVGRARQGAGGVSGVPGAPGLPDWQQFSKDWTYIAPDARRAVAAARAGDGEDGGGEDGDGEGGGAMPHLPETVDVFALGVLLELLQQKSGRAADDLEPARRADPWACLAFHCLCTDPDLRFQSAAQVETFLTHWVDRPGSDPPQTVEVPAGPAHVGGAPRAVPRFRIGVYPVTQFEYEAFCRVTGHPIPRVPGAGGRAKWPDPAAAPARLRGPWCPAVGVSLADAEAYCGWLSRRAGGRFRLPREAEWVRAAMLDEPPDRRPYPWAAVRGRDGGGDPSPARANFGRHYGGGPTVVGACPAGRSAAGCFDMAGNVWEWCTDFVSADEPARVLKGGAYDFPAADLRVAARHGAVVTCRSAHAGFRVVCEDV